MRCIQFVLPIALGLFSACVANEADTSRTDEADTSRPMRSGEEVLEREVHFLSGEARLSGVAAMPDAGGPFPAVVLVSGSGPQDRDGSTPGFVPGYQPSRDLAHRLARSGIASLRYDERGVGESTGVHTSASGAVLADDAEAAFRHLRGLREIDPGRVGLLGQSEGSNIIAMIAARNSDVAFVVSLAGPGVTGYEVVIAQSEHALRASGVEGSEFEVAMAGVQEQYQMVLNGEWAKLESMMREMLPAQLEAMSPEERAELRPMDEVIAEELTRMKTWTRFFLTHDPSEDWARVRAPILVLLGGLDVQVTVEQNRAPLEDALRRSPTDDWTVQVVPGANHLFQRAKTGQVDEYFALAPTIDPGVLETIASWIVDRIRP